MVYSYYLKAYDSFKLLTKNVYFTDSVTIHFHCMEKGSLVNLLNISFCVALKKKKATFIFACTLQFIIFVNTT